VRQYLSRKGVGIVELFRELDAVGDGVITIHKFSAWLRGEGLEGLWCLSVARAMVGSAPDDAVPVESFVQVDRHCWLRGCVSTIAMGPLHCRESYSHGKEILD
jgi:hypothetical protein